MRTSSRPSKTVTPLRSVGHGGPLSPWWSSPLFYFTEKAPPLSYCTAKATLLHLVGTMTFPEAPGLPRWCRDKESACNAGDLGSIPGLGRSPGEGNGNWYSCLGNSMDRGAWRTIVHGVAKSQTQLSTHTHTPESEHGAMGRGQKTPPLNVPPWQVEYF